MRSHTHTQLLDTASSRLLGTCVSRNSHAFAVAELVEVAQVSSLAVPVTLMEGWQSVRGTQRAPGSLRWV